MWCYKMPGFEALLVAELQRQQQIPQFCDTMLRAQSISVPAHSCVISAISPKLSAALSSSPTRQASYNHLVEFGTIGDSSLLHMVRLLYSGEMTGEGEHEKQEALSAAAKMGILGLVEVTPRVWQGTVGTEVGVQTDPVELREKDVACLRQEVIDSSTNLGKEMLSSCEKNIMTENEEMRVSSASSPQPVHAYNTIDMSQFQCLRQAENHNLYVPIPLVCTLDEAQNPQTSSTAGQVVTPSIAENSQNYFSSSSQAEFGVLEDEREVDEQLEQFRENIPGFINHFLNINPKEGAHGGQVKGKPRGAGGARQRKRSGTRARRPRACRGKGGWMQKVDTQEVGVSKQHKSLLHRCGNATTMRTGQGGGTTGRKLYLKTRHALDFPWTRHKGRGRPKKWDFSFSGKSHFEGQIGGDDNVKHESRRKSHLDKQVLPTAPHPAPLPLNPPEPFDALLEEFMKDMGVGTNSSVTDLRPCPEAQNFCCNDACCNGDTGCPVGMSNHGSTEVVTTEQANSEGDLPSIWEEILKSVQEHNFSFLTGESQEGQNGRSIPCLEGTKEERKNLQRATSRNASRRARTTQTKKGRKPHFGRPKDVILKSLRKTTAKLHREQGDKKLQQLPLVALKRSTTQLLNASSKTVSCQGLKNSAQLKTSSSSVHQPVSVITKLYPTRSRIKALEIAGQPLREELLPMLDQPFYRPRQRMKTQPPSEENAASLASVGHPASEVEMGLVEHSKELANSNSEISLTMGAGSEEGVNDEDNIDVIGFAGSCQDPVPIICPVISESEQDEEEEEIDVI
ncbi:uncharacterized protein LOC130924133 isoform X2 [Corythoichthys intestinalis]|uniref:uncharacterized protein LOC130924133 isoform X2 n=1 Tax=Corythoichthys intestinalis TaxID=161448 RepID=UPI0025A5AF28|nr:uncharacterized protein LOC130924133 isoform X2 [Corythoichthys intestinalis]